MALELQSAPGAINRGRSSSSARTRSAHLRLWAAIASTGAAAGLIGIAATALLHLTQRAAFGHPEETFLVGVENTAPARRVAVLALAGAVAGVGWLVLRRFTRPAAVADVVAGRRERLALFRTTADGVLQIVVVGLGASLGREGAPRQIAAAVGEWWAGVWRLADEERRLVIAAGAGAGLAAVYNVPVAGCLFTAEVLLRSPSARVVAAGLLASVIATAVSWLALPSAAVYSVGDLRGSGSLAVWAIPAGLALGASGWLLIRVMRRARACAPDGWRLPVATIVAFGALGAGSVAFPELLGNGQGATELAISGAMSGGLAAALFLLKPLATAVCLGSGARGGLLTPSLATGAVFGAATGHLSATLWPSVDPGACALVGGAAMLAVTLRAPLCAIALGIELTHPDNGLLMPIALAVGVATAAARLLDQLAATRHERR